MIDNVGDGEEIESNKSLFIIIMTSNNGSQYMTWMQASPLALVEQGTKRPSRLDELDLQLEQSAMRETFQGFPLVFSIATPNKLGNYFSQRLSLIHI